MRSESIIGNKRCYIYANGSAKNILIQAIGTQELELLDREVGQIKTLAPDCPFVFAAFPVTDWNRELSPWEAPAVFGNEDFGAGAKETLRLITEQLLTELYQSFPCDEDRHVYLGGYSLSGLFSLWAAYQTNVFEGIAAVSPSVWFPGWESYIMEHTLTASKVYLSLGDREAKTRNKVMAKVADNIRLQQAALLKTPTCEAFVFEWNPGNHFVDADLRTAKGFAWLLRA